MKPIEEVFSFLRKNTTFFLATDDGGQPRVRPFGAVNVQDGKLYIQTGNVKNVYKQMIQNPKVEICSMSTDGTWMRLTAKAVRHDDMAARQSMLDDNPTLKSMYAADDGVCEVLYLTDCEATFYSFTGAPHTITF